MIFRQFFRLLGKARQTPSAQDLIGNPADFTTRRPPVVPKNTASIKGAILRVTGPADQAQLQTSKLTYFRCGIIWIELIQRIAAIQCSCSKITQAVAKRWKLSHRSAIQWQAATQIPT